MLIVSKQFYREALQAYAYCTLFSFRTSAALQRFTQRAGTNLLQHVRRIEADFNVLDASALLDLAMACPRLRSLKLSILGSRILSTQCGPFDPNRCDYAQRDVTDIGMLQPLLRMRQLTAITFELGRCGYCGSREAVCSWHAFAEQMEEYVLNGGRASRLRDSW
ncbi:hypothetical protein LTR36_009650 [Oleoguttula mirabilis]|uniref:Uncharacterized protein n=1 Tax=Oleoguttula mirabilis TaxID=1507867 RepID=A0AAV9J622_9PEZI|nr:hypothetical protein LTR36_009650 [Oleoguttula mirabilis]